MDQDCGEGTSTVKTRKRKRTGRMKDVMKKLRLSTHERGASCNCLRYKCFEKLSRVDLDEILQNFNSMESVNEQNEYLCRLITVHTVHQRRNRKEKSKAKFHEASYSYKVRVKSKDTVKDVPVCHKAFISIHGITKGKVQHLQKALKITGEAPEDLRGKFTNMNQHIYKKIWEHVKLCKQKEDSTNTVSVKCCFDMFMKDNPNVKICYETYKNIFDTIPFQSFVWLSQHEDESNS